MNDISPPPPALPEGVGRAAEKLADTVRHVVDLFAGPKRIVAKAHAQAESALILARGDADKHDLTEARAVERLRKRETRRQENIESIAMQAVKALPPPEQISDKPVSEDWTTRFFEECQDISDEQMQQIWARILAGEVQRPGSFAPKTLSVVRDLTKRDADLFASLCRFTWLIPGAGAVPVVQDFDVPEFSALGLNFGTLTHLASISLIEFNNLTGFVLKDNLTEIGPSYCGKAYQLKSKAETVREFEIGQVMFTAVGRELVRVSNAQGSEEYRKMALDAWSKKDWKEQVQKAAA